MLCLAVSGSEIRKEIGQLAQIVMDLPDGSQLKTQLEDWQHRLLQLAEESLGCKCHLEKSTWPQKLIYSMGGGVRGPILAGFQRRKDLVCDGPALPEDSRRGHLLGIHTHMAVVCG